MVISAFTGPFPITIPEGGAPVDVTITFTPLTEGAQSADLAFIHNAAGSPISVSCYWHWSGYSTTFLV